MPDILQTQTGTLKSNTIENKEHCPGTHQDWQEWPRSPMPSVTGWNLYIRQFLPKPVPSWFPFLIAAMGLAADTAPW